MYLASFDSRRRNLKKKHRQGAATKAAAVVHRLQIITRFKREEEHKSQESGRHGEGKNEWNGRVVVVHERSERGEAN